MLEMQGDHRYLVKNKCFTYAEKNTFKSAYTFIIGIVE